MSEWKPIETAPKDGRWFCGCDKYTAHSYRARWNGRRYETEAQHINMKLLGYHHGWPPSMWTYLPDPPWMLPLPGPPK